MVRRGIARAPTIAGAVESPSAPKVKSKTAQKKESRADANFVKVMQLTFQDDHMSDLQYVHQTIDQNEAWVPWLASLFRSGRMARLVQQAASGDDDDDADLGKRLPTRIRKLAKLPKLELYHLLSELRGGLLGPDEVDGEQLLAVLQYILHFDADTPMPADEAAWRLGPLTLMCKRRDEDVGRRLKDVDFKGGIPDKSWLFWNQKSDGTVVYRPTEEEVELPSTDDTDQWTLDDPAAVRCTATSSKKKVGVSPWSKSWPRPRLT